MEQRPSPGRIFSGKLLIALLFILLGILLLAYNMGWISYHLFRILVSWHSLFILLGIYAMASRHYVRGLILLLIGTYLLLGGLQWLPAISQILMWPLAFIITGIVLLVKSQRKKRRWKSHYASFHPIGEEMDSTQGNFTAGQQQETVDGFLRSENVYGAARHVIFDELFKGADIRVSVGGTAIDLRHTHIAPGETYIDVDCSWGGVEIYVPSDWTVVFKCNAFFGGCEDKRWRNNSVNHECILVIRGKISCGGVTIKD